MVNKDFHITVVINSNFGPVVLRFAVVTYKIKYLEKCCKNVLVFYYRAMQVTSAGQSAVLLS